MIEFTIGISVKLFFKKKFAKFKFHDCRQPNDLTEIDFSGIFDFKLFRYLIIMCTKTEKKSQKIFLLFYYFLFI